MADDFGSASPELNLTDLESTIDGSDGWITQLNGNGTKTHTYNSNINTVQEAETAGYTDVENVRNAVNVTAVDNSYSYNLNPDGTVSNANTGDYVSLDYSGERGRMTTAAGSEIVTSSIWNRMANNTFRESGAITQMDFSSPFFVGGAIASFFNTTSTVYRVYGGDARPDGYSWTPDNPNRVPDFRDSAGLPSGGESGANNTGRFVIEGTVKNKKIMRKKMADPLDGKAGNGVREYIINPKDVKIRRVSGANPEF